jgi:hypothetical protein
LSSSLATTFPIIPLATVEGFSITNVRSIPIALNLSNIFAALEHTRQVISLFFPKTTSTAKPNVGLAEISRHYFR